MSDLVLKMSQRVSIVRWMLLLISHAVPHELLSNFVLTKWKSDQFVDAPLFQQWAFKTKHPCPEKCQSYWLCWERALCTKSKDVVVIVRGYFGTPSAMFELRERRDPNTKKGCEKSCSSATLCGKPPTISHSIQKEHCKYGGWRSAYWWAT